MSAAAKPQLVMNRCAIYARYSSDKQSATSITDQVRKCREYAAAQQLAVLDRHLYIDEAMSGAGSDRPGFTRLVAAALARERAFDILLIDDTSRLARDTAEMLRVCQRLNFAGVRVIAIAQGVDTNSEQADTLITVHGLVDSLYIRELAKKTHRGMEGQVLRGFYPAGRCFGYRNVNTPEGCTLEIEPAEAAILKRLFEMSAAGASLKQIAHTLNAERIPSPRPRKDSRFATWCPNAIREMLRRELYVGRLIWNRSHFLRVPGTNRRVRRARPQAEWRIVEKPELRIVSDAAWRAVQARIRRIHREHGDGLRYGRAASPYLFSGILKCGACGGNLVIVNGHGGGRYLRYGCSHHFNRGTCKNAVTVRRDRLEETLLSELQSKVLTPAAIEYVIKGLAKYFEDEFSKTSATLAEARQRKTKLEAELRRLTTAVAESGHSQFLLGAIAEREAELREIQDALLGEKAPASIASRIEEWRATVQDEMAQIRGLLADEQSRAAARGLVQLHVREIRMMPKGEGRAAHYVCEGEWMPLGGDAPGPVAVEDSAEGGSQAPRVNGRAWHIAGARFELATFGL